MNRARFYLALEAPEGMVRTADPLYRQDKALFLIDVSRGCMLVKDTELIVSSMFTAVILWMDDSELTQGKNFLVKIGTKLISAAIMDIKYRIDIHTGEHLAATFRQRSGASQAHWPGQTSRNRTAR